MQVVRYNATWFDVDGGGNSYVKFATGQVYLPTEETLRHVSQGAAEVIEAPDDADAAQNEAARLAKKAAAAVAAAQEAQARADAALQAAALAEQAAAAAALMAPPAEAQTSASAASPSDPEAPAPMQAELPGA